MQLEDYLDFVSPDEIRIRGTRIGIEAILTAYFDGASPEEIALNYPPVTLGQVYGTIAYYFQNRAAIDAYLDRWTARGDEALRRQRENASPVLERLLQERDSRTGA